jgi:hypothetical protein
MQTLVLNRTAGPSIVANDVAQADWFATKSCRIEKDHCGVWKQCGGVCAQCRRRDGSHA